MSEDQNTDYQAEEATEAEAPKKVRKARAPKLDENGNPIVKAPKEPKVRETKIPRDAKITLLVDKNPKRPGSKAHAHFEGYFGAETVAEALANGVNSSSLFHDVGHGFIKIEGYPKD